MYHYDAATALEELQEDALLPHPVKMRDIILRLNSASSTFSPSTTISRTTSLASANSRSWRAAF